MNDANNFNVEQQQNMFEPHYQQNNYSNVSIANRGMLNQKGPEFSMPPQRVKEPPQ